MEYHKEEDSAFNVLDFALQSHYADDPEVNGIYYDPLYMEMMKEARVSTEGIKDDPEIDVINYLLGLFDLTTKRVDDCIFIYKHPQLFPIL